MLGEGTTTLPKEIAPRNNHTTPPPKKNPPPSNFFSFKNLIVYRIHLFPPQVPLEASRGVAASITYFK